MNQVAPAAFPTLDDDQLCAVAQLSELVEFETNQSLIRQGQKDYPFYVIRSGSVRIVELTDDKESLIVNHGPREFTGDVDMLTGRSAVISAIANEPVQAYQLCSMRLRKLLNECPAVSDLLLDAFQIRRKLLAASDFVGVKVVGEANTPDTSRLQEFFYKNHVP